MHKFIKFFFYLLLMALPNQSFADGKKVALVIGNANYTRDSGFQPLSSPLNDARAMADKLSTLGFSISGNKPLLDGTKDQMDAAIEQFMYDSRDADIVLFYYSGHGASRDNKEALLLPLGKQFKEFNFRESCIGLETVVSAMNRYDTKGKSKFKIIILDACRSAPFSNPFDRSKDASDVNKGLVRTTPPDGFAFCYATAPGETAIERANERYSVYTEALLAELSSEKKFPDMMAAVSKRVKDKTNKRQAPIYEHDFSGDFSFGSLASIKPTTGFLTVKTTPVGTTVYIDGKNVGKTPLSKYELSTGKHSLRLTKDSNYKERVTDVEIITGSDREVEYVLTAISMNQENENVHEERFPMLAYTLKDCLTGDINKHWNDYHDIKKVQDEAAKGNALFQAELGVRYYYGENGVSRDYNESIKWLQLAAEKGHSEAFYFLGECYYHGNGVTTDYERSYQMYQIAADKGHRYAGYKLAWIYLNKEENAYDSKAFEILRKAAKNDADAQNALGYCYKLGRGVAVNYDEAFKWYNRAANSGSGEALNNLGVMYFYGQGVTQSHNEAFRCFEKASSSTEEWENKFNLAICYFYGYGVKKDSHKAYSLFSSIQNWYTANEANNFLGVCFYQGTGVEKDPVRSFKCFKRAAELSWGTSQEAQFNLGYCYENGIGVTINLQEANKWYQKATINGLNKQ